MLTQLYETATLAAGRFLAVDPSPAPGPAAPVSVHFNYDGVMRFLISWIGPILLAALGVVFLARARKGELSATFNSGAVALIGVVFLVGSAALLGLGGWLSDLVVTR